MSAIGIFGAIAGFLAAILGIVAIVTIIENRKNPITPILFGLAGILGTGGIVLLVVDLIINMQNSIASKVFMGFLRLFCPSCGF
jgi:hypothetical protein